MSTERFCSSFWSCGRSRVVESWPSLLAPQLLLYFLCYPGLQPWEKQHPEMCPFQLLNHTPTFFEEDWTHHLYKHARNYIISNPFSFSQRNYHILGILLTCGYLQVYRSKIAYIKVPSIKKNQHRHSCLTSNVIQRIHQRLAYTFMKGGTK